MRPLPLVSLLLLGTGGSTAGGVGPAHVGTDIASNVSSATGLGVSAGTAKAPGVDDGQAIEMAETLCAAEAAQLCGSEPTDGSGGGSIGCLLRLSAGVGAQAGGISAGCEKVLDAARAQLLAQSLPDPRVGAACAAPLRSGVCRHALRTGGASVPLVHRTMRCLRSPLVRAALPHDCRREVTRLMMGEARNISLDVYLYHACALELSAPPCAGLAGGAGARRACLQRSQDRSRLAAGNSSGAWPMSRRCSRALSASAIERSDDIRFHAPLLDACAAERVRFCVDLHPGDGRVIGCLLQHRGHRDTAPACRQQLHVYEQRAMADFRLDAPLVGAAPPLRYPHPPLPLTHTPPVVTPTPAVFTPTPSVFTPTSSVFTPTPAVFTRTPAVLTRTPSVFTPTPAVFTPTLEVFTLTPAVFTPTPAVFTPTLRYSHPPLLY